MPTATWTPLANLTLGSSASSVTFSNIPNTYRDLVVVLNYSETDPTSGNITVTYNGDTGNNYSQVFMRGADNNTTQSSSGTYSVHYLNSTSRSSGSRGATILQIMDYSATDKHKTTLGRVNPEVNNVYAYAYRWASTSAITSIKIAKTTDSFASGSTFALYGVIA